jgi:exoribonuclease R
MYKIHINDRNYTRWTCYNVLEFKPVELDMVNPALNKLFAGDVFNMDTDTKQVNIEHSHIRTTQSIPGILVLNTSKTYGRSNGANGKLLYKVIPDDVRIPSFLVPYEIKHMGFSKVFVNMYVTFNYLSWDDKHPRGILSNVLGPVDVLDNFYEYQLYCKNLNVSIQKFTKEASKSIGTENRSFEAIREKYSNIEDRTGEKWRVFTIDPPNSVDFDDGFSIYESDSEIVMSIYISNVTIMLDVLNLWESFSRRVSTIYLPDRKRPMLPTILSDNLCSLCEKFVRFAFFMDVVIDKETNDVKDIRYGNCTINVYKNYCYEDSKMLNDANYKRVFDATSKLSKIYRYIPNVRNSRDMVCYLMTFMNYHCAKDLLSYKNGIFRYSIMKNENVYVPSNLPEDVGKFIKIWNSSGGQYIDASVLVENETITRHELLDMDAYIHITSPIRRLVDLLNIIQFQQNHNMLELSEGATTFYRHWTSKPELEYINTTMRSIRKVQNDCTMLELYTNHPEKTEPLYDGYLFDKIERNDGMFQYVVYLPDLKMNSRIISHDNLNNYDKHKFKIYLFNDEETLKKKIRLQIITE